jgi:DNA-binding transcriptional ArsR family regulator
LPDKSTPPPRDADEVLTGTTVRVYRFLVTRDEPVGPRELQKQLKLSSPAVASFHLEKLLKNGLVSKNESEGTYTVDRVYLKHFIRLRRHLVPRYFFYALLSTFLSIGWLALGYLGGLAPPLSKDSIFLFVYGPSTTVILACIFWYETLNVLRREKL